MKAMIGAHNCLTAYRPTKWWMGLVSPVWKCQRLTIGELIEKGVEFFDIRVSRDNDRWVGAHGIAKVDVEIWPLVYAIADGVSSPVIRLILEHGDKWEQTMFASMCNKLELIFPSVKFIGGNFKPTWEKLYDFESDDIGDNICQMVGSMDVKRKWFGAVWPWLYARLYNKRHLATVEDGKFYLFDYL